MSKRGTDRLHQGILRLLSISAAAVLGGFQIWSSGAVTPPELVINEVAYRGTEASSSDEWIELYNPNTSFVDLTGWTLFLGSKALPLQGVVDPHGYYLLERSDDDTISSLEADLIYTGSLTDSGVELRLVNDLGFTIDELSQWYVSISDRSSMERLNPFIGADYAFNWGVFSADATALDANGNLILGTPRAANSSTLRVFGYGYGYPVFRPGPPPSAPAEVTALQMDHRVRIIWQPASANHSTLLRLPSETIELTASPFFWTPSDQSFPLEAQLVSRDLFLQESPAEDLLLVYEYPRSPLVSELKINEFLPHPQDGESEWIELANSAEGWLSLGNCELQDERATIHRFESTAAVHPQGFLLTELSSARLNNAGDDITLRCDGVEIDTVSYGDHAFGEFIPSANGLQIPPRAAQGQSIGRVGSEKWFVFATPTPAAPNPSDLSLLPNTEPEPVITIQGNGSSTGCRVLHFNPTGADSFDAEDNILFHDWEYHLLGTPSPLFQIRKENPSSFAFREEIGRQFTVTLTVTDLFGVIASKTIPVELGHCSKRQAATSAKTNPPGASQLIINEVFPNPYGKDAGQEYIELYNPGPYDVLLDDWKLGGKTKKSLDGHSISAGGFLIFENITLRNSEDHLELSAPDGQLIDELEYADVEEGQSFALHPSGQFRWTIPTPAAENDFPFTQETIYLNESAPVIITSFLANPDGKDTDREWITILNRTEETISLDGWQLDNRQGGSAPYHIPGLILQPSESKTFSSKETGITLRNSTDQVRILDASGQLIDQLEWKTAIGSGVVLHREDLTRGDLIPPEEATVIEVIDGDTIDVLLRGKVERVRLIGVDTPETVHPFKEVEHFGKEASNYTKSQLQDARVTLEYDLSRRGKYGRLLAYVHIGERHFNAELISEGYAFAYLKYPFRYREDFRVLEKKAQAQGLGLWSSEEPQRLREQQEEVQDEELLEFEIIEEEILAAEEAPEIREDPEPSGQIALPRQPVSGVAYLTEGWSDMRISEILPNPSGRDSAPSGEFTEFIELNNLGSHEVDLRGWKILSSKGRVLFDGNTTKLVMGAHEFQAIIPLKALKNRDESLRLMTPLGVIQDEVSYQEGFKENSVFARDPDSGDWKVSSSPTPAEANIISLPIRKSRKKASSKISPHFRIVDLRQQTKASAKIPHPLMARVLDRVSQTTFRDRSARPFSLIGAILLLISLLTLQSQLPNLGAIFSSIYGANTCRKPRK